MWERFIMNWIQSKIINQGETSKSSKIVFFAKRKESVNKETTLKTLSDTKFLLQINFGLNLGF